MTPEYKIHVQKGDIEVNHVIPLALHDDALVFAIDCVQKRPEYDADCYTDDDGQNKVIVSLEAGEETLNVESRVDTPTMVTIKIDGEWHSTTEYGKWGPLLYLIRKMERDKNWPGWHPGEQ